MEMEFQRQGGVEHFGISEGKGGKISMPPMVWYGYFLESPISKFYTKLAFSCSFVNGFHSDNYSISHRSSLIIFSTKMN